MGKFSIWMEGFRVSGEVGAAEFVGETEAATFAPGTVAT